MSQTQPTNEYLYEVDLGTGLFPRNYPQELSYCISPQQLDQNLSAFEDALKGLNMAGMFAILGSGLLAAVAVALAVDFGYSSGGLPGGIILGIMGLVAFYTAVVKVVIPKFGERRRVGMAQVAMGINANVEQYMWKVACPNFGLAIVILVIGQNHEGFKQHV